MLMLISPSSSFKDKIQKAVNYVYYIHDLSSIKHEVKNGGEHADFVLSAFELDDTKFDIVFNEIKLFFNDDFKIDMTKTKKFINFKIPDNLWKLYVDASIDKIREPTQFLNKIIIEHTSANPTDNLHIGRIRNSIIGDSIARLHKFVGHNVEIQYYVDDVGKQAVLLTLGKRLHLDSKVPFSNYNKDYQEWSGVLNLGDYQLGNYVNEVSPNIENGKKWLQEIDNLILKIEKGDPDLRKEIMQNCNEVIDNKIKPTLKKLNILDQRYVYESDFITSSSIIFSVDKVIEKLKPLAKNENGAFYFDVNDDKFFFTRDDGTSLYTTRDLAYHIWKFDNANQVINILGEDHKTQARNLEFGLEKLGINKKPKNIFYSFVGLKDGKMSTRKGNVVLANDVINLSINKARKILEDRDYKSQSEKSYVPVIDESIAEKVGVGAFRFNIISTQANKQIIFDIDKALNFEGKSGPYLQYTLVRCNSILKDVPLVNNYTLDKCNTPSEINLIKKIGYFTEVIHQTLDTYEMHEFANYIYDFAVKFNAFYRDCNVLNCDPKLKESRIHLVQISQYILESGLEILGVPVLTKM